MTNFEKFIKSRSWLGCSAEKRVLYGKLGQNKKFVKSKQVISTRDSAKSLRPSRSLFAAVSFELLKKIWHKYNIIFVEKNIVKKNCENMWWVDPCIESISQVAIYEEPLNEFVHGDADLMLIFYGVILEGTADKTVRA